MDELAKKLESQQVKIKNFQFNLSQIIIFAGAIVQLIASILPMFSIDIWGYSATVSYIEGDGIIALGLVIAVCICSYLDKKQIALGLALANLALIFYDSFLSGADTYGMVKLSIGGYLLIITSVVIAACCALSFIYSQNK